MGIHLRGTDNDTKRVSLERIATEALKNFNNNTQFLIASYEKILLNRMITLLGGRRVIYYDCYRSKNGLPSHIRRCPSFA